jgi:hypothetical protein
MVLVETETLVDGMRNHINQNCYLIWFGDVVEGGVGRILGVAGDVGHGILTSHVFHRCRLLEPRRPHIRGPLLELGQIIQRRIGRSVGRHLEAPSYFTLPEQPQQPPSHLKPSTLKNYTNNLKQQTKKSNIKFCTRKT